MERLQIKDGVHQQEEEIDSKNEEESPLAPPPPPHPKWRLTQRRKRNHPKWKFITNHKNVACFCLLQKLYFISNGCEKCFFKWFHK